VTRHVHSSPPLENQVHCSDPAGSSTTLKVKQLTFHNWRVQRIKKTPTSQGVQKSKVNVARYSPASVRVVQNMQIAIYCSCPQDSDAVKVILLAPQQQKNRRNHFKSVVHICISWWAHLLGEGHHFRSHSGKACALSGLCASPKEAFAIGGDAA